MDITPVEERWQPGEVAESYDTVRFESFIGRLFQRLQHGALQKCLRLIPAESHVMDIPCGTGRMLPILSEHASSVIAMDVSEAMMEQAKRRMAGCENIRFMSGSAKELPLDDASVDAIFCIRFAMHLKGHERGEILREFARVTRSHVVVEYGCVNAWHRVRRLLRSFLFRIRRKHRSYPRSLSRREIVDEASAVGLTVCRWFSTHRLMSESVFVLMKKNG